MSAIQNIENLSDFQSWAITSVYYESIIDVYSNYDDALDAYENKDGYENKDIQLSYIVPNPYDKDDYLAKEAPIVF